MTNGNNDTTIPADRIKNPGQIDTKQMNRIKKRDNH